MERRSFIELATKLGGAAAIGVVGGPALLTTLTPAFSRREPAWVPVGSFEDFPLGAVRRAVAEIPRGEDTQSLQRVGVFVVREDVNSVAVFSRTCTDLGCPVTWDPGSGWFFCPCHGGIFARDGSPQAGPPGRPLYRYETRIEDGMLLIDLNSVPPMA